MTGKDHKPNKVIIAPAEERNQRFLIVADSFCANKPLLNIEGRVPRPKASMISAEPKKLASKLAQIKAEYTKPHGSQPHTMPTTSASLIDLIGIKRFDNG